MNCLISSLFTVTFEILCFYFQYYRYCLRTTKLSTIFAIVVLCSVSFMQSAIVFLFYGTSIDCDYITVPICPPCHYSVFVNHQLFFSMYPDRERPWRMLAVSSTESFCILCIYALYGFAFTR